MFAKDASEFRRKIVLNGFDMFIATERLTWSYDPEIGTPEEWVDKMSSDGVYGDEIFLQLASNILNRDIVIIPVFKDQAHVQQMEIKIVRSATVNRNEQLFLLAYTESRFVSPHYQSIRPEASRDPSFL